MNGGAFAILNPRSFVAFFWIMAVKKTEKIVPLIESDVQIFLEGNKTKIGRLNVSLVSYRVKHSKRNSVSTRAHVFSISYYYGARLRALRAPLQYNRLGA